MSDSVTGLMGEMATAAQSLNARQSMAAIEKLLQDPSSDPRLAMILLAIVILGALTVTIMVLFLLTPSRRKVVKIRRYAGLPDHDRTADAADAANAPPTEPASQTWLERVSDTPAGRLATGWGGTALLVMLLAAATYVGTGTDAYCAKTCHAGSKAVTSAAEDGHGASCSQCHEQPGLRGVPGNTASRIRMVMRQTLDPASPGRALGETGSRSCLGCHDDLLRTTVVTEDGTAISHREFTEDGWPCAECHAGVGHEPVAQALMSKCVLCHDSRQASSECGTCHTEGSEQLARRDDERKGVARAYPAVRAAKRDCSGCHNETEECDSCHGTRMPHSQAFLEGGHAKDAAFERKLACYKCHDPAECGFGCHTSFKRDGSSTHPGDWKSEHKNSSPNAGCVCHSGRSDRKEPICIRCH